MNMGTIAYILLATLIVCLLIIVIAKLLGSKTNIVSDKKINFHIDENTPDGLIVQKVKQLFDDNIALPINELQNKIGLPVHDMKFENEDYKDVFNSYLLAISNRYSLLNEPIIPIDSDRYNLNLQDGESLFYRINGTDLYEEKVVRRNVVYSGTRWGSGPLRAGSLSYTSNEIKNFVVQDVGRLFLTNKRVIFVGAQKNITKAIKLSSIITYYLYQDGVLILQGNSKGLLFKFEDYHDPLMIQDGINEFTIIISRLLDDSYSKNMITRDLIPTSDSETNTTPYISNLKLPDPLLLDSAYTTIDYEQVSALLIQRKLKIGLSRANRIIDELIEMQIISKADNNGQCKVLITDKVKIEEQFRR